MHLRWQDQDYLYYITNRTRKHNIDNISRTKAYQHFYFDFPEIKWALIASVVSRNAGWNMTDLHLAPYKKMLGEAERKRLFMTYERANWLIFSDAFPQLIVYQLSIQHDYPLFYLLRKLRVSTFMIREWEHFWQTNNKDRLMIALIINEQNVIQAPVISQSFFRKKVFLSLPYMLQNALMLNAVILPTHSGELYGAFVHHFTDVTNRITLGKQLANQIFHPELYSKLIKFVLSVEHTGSRTDYEKFLDVTRPKGPMLRMVYPIIEHQDIIRNDWFYSGGMKKKWFKAVLAIPNEIGTSFYLKRKLLYAYYHLKNIVT
ncbi:DUF2515 family protein [Ornithinibacillus xuwenensis]|uniref:DUF2515 family protein n=1 Tax=Ornithinibacillus xuwenensis TaxID=3144668 RepID=A0ABU9XD63_9BACI